VVAATEAEGVALAVTPNGIPIYFQHEPKRLYRIGPSVDGLPDFSELIHRAQAPLPLGWEEVPSVSQVLDVLHKPGLPWWGMVQGVEGLMTLHQLGLLRETIGLDRRPALAGMGPDGPHPIDSQGIVDLLTVNQLTVNHVRDRAGDRGLAVHDALEGWAESGKLPDPSMYAATEVAYVRALRQFLVDVDPEPIASEVMVASREYGYAGRYDLRLRVTKPSQVVARCGLKRGPVLKTLQPGEILTDLKSSKGVYESHPRQLEGYEHASLESGWDETSARGILHVTEDGEYEFVRSWSVFEDFLAVLMVWKSDQAMKARKKGITG
jgi:hypothetical protein